MDAILILTHWPGCRVRFFWKLVDADTGDDLLNSQPPGYGRRADARRQAKAVAKRADVTIIREELVDA